MHSVIIYIFILVDDRFSVIACLLVSSISPAVKASLHQKLSSESLTTFIWLVIDVGLLKSIRLMINDGFNLLNLTVLATVFEYCVSDAIASRSKVAFV